MNKKRTPNYKLQTTNSDQLTTTNDQRIKKILLLGSGALKIGEAGEFDYSGSQALKALKEEGITTILINPNIATVQTSEGIADKIYFLPVTPHFVEKVIIKEKPDGILLSFGGQTALNCGIELFKKGILEKYNVKVLGTPIQSVIDTEDRELFVQKLDEINVSTIKSRAVSITNYELEITNKNQTIDDLKHEKLEELKSVANELGYPVIIRAAYALGGQGSGFCNNEEELLVTADKAFSYSNQILIEKSLKGWKEIEYEVVRDRYDNCITVCNMENFDPLGIHTGESIVVAPSQTLTNAEYHKLREIAIRIIRHIGIVGECNVQYALDPDSEDYRVIEVNARLSRSSALASKATGYPLAFVAAKLALGYSLHELKNSITRSTTACFEPALDYIVCKIPRWDLGKFKGVSKLIGSSMKSVGEVMAIGRTFEEAIQKGLRMIGQGMHGFVGNKDIEFENTEQIRSELSNPTDMRIFVIAMAMYKSFSIDEIHELTRIDRLFLYKLQNIINLRNEIAAYGSIEAMPADLLTDAKKMGFSDFQLAKLILSEKDNQSSVISNQSAVDGNNLSTNYELRTTNLNELQTTNYDLPTNSDPTDYSLVIRRFRKQHNIIPFVKQIDTVAAEYPAQTNYLYVTYNGSENDIDYGTASRSVIVLGSGAYRIGSSVEFDWSSVNVISTLKKHNLRAVMINFNPETVSTDYDISDRLYFEELTFERVMDIIDLEQPLGVIVSCGGQIPNNLAMRLHNEGVRILGTSAISIDCAEDRHKFSAMCDRLGIDQPRWQELSSIDDILGFAAEVGYPLLVRPSYVLSGAAMNVVSNADELEYFLKLAANVSRQYPVVVSEFIENAKEIEFDAVSRNGEIIVYAISEHIEFAGVHSGDATIVFPAQKLYVETIRRIKRIARLISGELNITGPFNIQFLARDNDIKVIECNLRASRSFPFVSKVLKTNFIELATEAMLGNPVGKPAKSAFDLDYVGVKAPQFSFSRLQKADPILGVEMASTGEVGCIGEDYYEAVLKSMLSVGYTIPGRNILLSTGPSRSKIELLNSCRMLLERGYALFATKGTHNFLEDNGIESTQLSWPDEAAEPNTETLLRQKQIDLVINIPKDLSRTELYNDYRIRRLAVDYNIPLITDARLASAFIYSICRSSADDVVIKSWDEY